MNNLAINFNNKLKDIKIYNQYSSPIYRYFSKKKDRDNFCEGNIWVAGPTQNRFFNKNPDKLEHRCEGEIPGSDGKLCHFSSSYLFSYTLSFTEKKYNDGDNNKFWIEIIDIENFLQSIKNDVLNSNGEFTHQVSFLDAHEVKTKADEQGVTNYVDFFFLKECPKKEDQFKIGLSSISADLVTYEDKSQPANSLRELPKKTHNKNCAFRYENEFRIEFNCCDFLEPKLYNGKNLGKLVQYLKLSCPSIKEYCKLI